MDFPLEKARKPFHVLTLTLLSLLLPLSFLLLARHSYATFLYNLSPTKLTSSQTSFLSSPFFQLNKYPNPLNAVVAALTIATLLHSLTSKINIFDEESLPITPVPDTHTPRLCVAWAMLCTVEVFVGLGIEGSISSGIAEPCFDTHRITMLRKMIFFLGLYEAMLYWCRVVVKPVVDDTIFGQAMAERWSERAFMAAAYGGLWWLMMMDEVEGLVMVGEVKKEMVIRVEMVDFFNQWLYYLIETIGRVRIVKGMVWMVMVLFWKRRENPKWAPADMNMV